MGILDKKSRIMDVIVTPEGRRQIHSGDFRAEFVSYSDKSAYYSSDSVTGSVAEDASRRLYFESSYLPIDKVIFEVDSDGQLVGSDSNLDPNIRFTGEGGILERAPIVDSTTGTSNETTYTPISDTRFLGVARGITSSSIENFNKLKIISSVNSSEFNMKLNDNRATFDINNIVPFGELPINKIVNVEAAEPIVYDSKFNHLTQFKFLPPVNNDSSAYGVYTNLGGNGINSFDDVINEIGILPEDSKGNLNQLNKYVSNFLHPQDNDAIQQNIARADNGFKTTNNKQKKSFIFNNTNFSSNYLTQIFEISPENTSVNKLQIVDAGEFIDENDTGRPYKRMFYAGKVYRDFYGIPVFVTLFTLIYD